MKKVMKAIVALMLITAAVCAAGCTKDDLNNGGNNGGGGNGGTLNGHQYVDLGLPSGMLWATCNVGANSPEEYGDYFAWGETEPKSAYDWDTYKWCNGGDNTLTKYCSDRNCGYNGFTDYINSLQSVDDAATANWGSGWRMPTIEEWEELFENTTYTWDTQNGVYGRSFTASNGNTLFMPAAGGWDYELYDADMEGLYWSNTLCAPSPSNAWAIRVLKEEVGLEYSKLFPCARAVGFSVRPVHVN